LRLWRIPRPDTILNPEAYLLTIANHVLHQYALRESMTPATLERFESVVSDSSDNDPSIQVELQQRLQELESALAGLSYKAQAALVLYRRDGFSLEEIAKRLGISRAMVKKYVAKAVLHCRINIPTDE